MTSVITNLNAGFEDGFHNNEPKKPDNDDYMFSYRVGQADRQRRLLRHLKEKRKTDRGLDMRDWLNDKADSRFEEHVIREYFALEDDDPIPASISDIDRAEIYDLVENGHYE